MIIVRFSFQDKLGKIWFFKEIFLLVDTNIKIVLGMFFLTLNNIDIQFNAKSLIGRSYTIIKVLTMIKQIELIVKHKFVQATLDKNFKIFIIYIVALDIS